MEFDASNNRIPEFSNTQVDDPESEKKKKAIKQKIIGENWKNAVLVLVSM